MPPVNIRETVLQAVRSYVIQATGLPSASVIIAGAGQVRPSMPYISIVALTPGIKVGQDEVLRSVTLAGQLQERPRGHRRCTVQVSAWGTDASDYLELVRLQLELPTQREILDVVSMRVIGQGPGMGLRGTGFEERSNMDLEVTYRIEIAPADAVAAEHFEWEVTLYRDNPPADLVAGSTESI